MNYVAFYPSKPYWAASKIDFQDPNLRENFRANMSEVVFSRKTDQRSISVCRDGRISLHISGLVNNDSDRFNEVIERWGLYLNHLNVIFLMLDSAVMKNQKLGYFNLHEVTNRDAFTWSCGKNSGETIAIESIAGKFQRARNYDYHAGPVENEEMFFGRELITIESIEDMASMYFNVSEDLDAIEAFSGISRAVSAFKITNFRTSIIFSWFVIESILNMKWEDYLEDSNKKLLNGYSINRNRRETLNGRDYTSSVKSNMLELSGRLDYELYSSINEIRKKRNKIVHQQSGLNLTRCDALTGVGTAIKMAAERWDISVEPNFAISVSGL